jgi:hypothetical protein
MKPVNIKLKCPNGDFLYIDIWEDGDAECEETITMQHIEGILSFKDVDSFKSAIKEEVARVKFEKAIENGEITYAGLGANDPDGRFTKCEG